ncbi:MAG: hypothetical protein J0L99_05350 [Chitinophagales bacterium]|nr:hypothetical protein [Chitinophagales bacterium]
MRTLLFLFFAFALNTKLSGQGAIVPDSLNLKTLSNQAVESIILYFFETNTDSSKNDYVFVVDSLLIPRTDIFHISTQKLLKPLFQPDFQLDTFQLDIREKIKPHAAYYKSIKLEDHINDTISIHAFSPLIPAKVPNQFIMQKITFFNDDDARVAALQVFRFTIENGRLTFLGRIDIGLVTVWW